MSCRACARCGRDSVSIHARGLCSLCYRDHRDEYPRTKFHRPYTTREREVIRSQWGRRPATAIAADLGRKVRDVYAAAVRFGAAQPRHVLKTDPQLRDYLQRLHAQGLSDREIGQVAGFGHATVARWLRRLGLASNCRTRPTDPFPEATKAKIRDAMLRRIRADGLESAVAFLRRHAEGRATAARLGWPQADSLLEGRILDRLCDAGPSTLPALREVLGGGLSWLGQVVRTLQRRGLVSTSGRDGRWCRYGLAAGVVRSKPRRGRDEGPVPPAKPRGEGEPVRTYRVLLVNGPSLAAPATGLFAENGRA